MRWLFTLAVLTSSVQGAAAQPSADPAATRAARDPLTAVIAVDSSVRVGKLPNGMEYFIRPNPVPQGRAELRLVVKAGSVLEDDDQRGMAHFVEHMAFNGTENFPGQDVAAFIQSLGMRFGAHVNAHTAFDETVYQLQIPTDNRTVIDRSFLILEDFAHRVSFETGAIDKERGVVLEEWRQGLGAESRVRDAQMPVLLKGARYADRSPIGRPEIIQNVSPARLKQFYADWYRPDLLAVIAVGDFNPAVVEQMIAAHFSGIVNPPTPRPRPTFTVPGHDGTLYSLISDREVSNTTVTISSIAPAGDQRTVGTYRQQMVDRLFTRLLSSRFEEIAHQPNAPFLAARTDRGLFVRTAVMTTVAAMVPDGGADRGLAALLAETERVVRFGFTQSELDREKLDSQRYLDEALLDKDKTPSGPLADELVRHVVQDEPVPGIVYEQAMSARFLPEISLQEVNGLAKAWIPDANRAIAVTAPQRAGLALPTEARLAAVVADSKTAKLSPYVDRVTTTSLLPASPTPGTVVKENVRSTIGVTEWTLSNGAKVVLKPTTMKEDEVLFRAVSPGGTSLASDQDYIAATTAERVIADGGLGTLSTIDLSRALAGASAAVQPDISDVEEGVRGGSTRKDIEKMFQLLYLTFTAPRADPVAFDSLKSRLTTMLANQQARPETAFRDAIVSALTQDHPRARPLTAASVSQMNLERSLAFYKNRFADASDFTFVFVGRFEVAEIKPLVERYLASLPALHRSESAVDRGVRAPAGVVTKEVVKGVEPKSDVAIIFTGTFENTATNRLLYTTMGQMVSGNLHQTLREDLGGTYGVSVDSRFEKYPRSEYQISIRFSCDPARVDQLVKAAWTVITDFATRGPSLEHVANARGALEREYEVGYQENADLLNEMTTRIENAEDIADVFDPRPMYAQITRTALQSAAQSALSPDRFVQVVLRPEK